MSIIITPDLRASIARLVQAQCECTAEQAERAAARITDLGRPLSYSPWRHGGWYVSGVRYMSGASGCVSRNYPDKKWRIVCDPRPDGHAHTYPNRDAAARAEQALALAEYITPGAIEREIAKAQRRNAEIRAHRAAAVANPDHAI